MFPASSRTAARLLSAFVLTLSAAIPARAQDGAGQRLRSTVRSLSDSAHVRILAPGLIVEDGLFLGFQGDSMRVADADAHFTVGLEEIQGLSVRGSRWLGVGLQSGAVGLVAGAAAGYFLGYLHCGDQVQECGGHALSVALRWGGVFGVVGGAAGAVLGSRSRQWRRVYP